MGTTQVKTWADLLAAIFKMSPDQQQQPIQCVRSEPDDAIVCECLPGIAVGTVSEMGFYKCRSVVDNKYRGNDVVLLLDGNPYSPDGAMMHRWNGEDWEPCYDEGGPTDPLDQMSPEARAAQ